MGQYYKPIILGPRGGVKAWFYSHEYGNGLKLMEHSYIGNSFCNAVENYLIDNPQRLVWAGDYADCEKGKKYNLYDKADNKKKVSDGCKDDVPQKMFVVNHTKKEYYLRDDILPCLPAYSNDEEDWKVNPLPILTCEGNGRGGGDYHPNGGDTYELVGYWARDVIELTDTEPLEYYRIEPFFSE